MVGGNSECIIGRLSIWRFDRDLCRKKLAAMIIKEELPFKYVEGERFKDFIVAIHSRFKIPSRWTISRDCYQLYLDEKVKLCEFFQKSRQIVCITTDTWTSLQQLSYMCIIAHFIDTDWTLHKRLSISALVYSHSGEDLGKELDDCFARVGNCKVVCNYNG